MAVGKERKKGKGEGEKEGAHTEAAAAHSGGGDKRSNRGAGVPLAGTDDAGNFYASHEQLMDVQESNKAAWYEANKEWWVGGYGGSTDSAAMIGDDEGAQDGEEGLRFLDSLLAARPQLRPRHAIDAGAGVGRVTRDVLLKRFETVHLIEADSGWSKRSKVYLGKKRAARCTFTCARLECLPTLDAESTDVVWIQWTLQYLTDRDAVIALQALAGTLRRHGVLVIKENRPYGAAREDRFQLETPSGEEGRYDITRTDAHHRVLFGMARLEILMHEAGVETNSYVLSPEAVK